MTYDLAGNLATNTDERGNVYTYVYDALNRLTSMVYPSTEHEDKSYDAAGNLATYTNRSGSVQTFTYDNRNRATDSSWNDGDHVMATHGLRSSLTGHTDRKQHFDDQLRIRQRQPAPDPGRMDQRFSDNVHRTVTYTYDADGNRATVQYPSGQAFNYTYTNRSQASAVKPGLTGGTAIVNYTYDPSGNITNRTLDNGTSSAYTIDQLNRQSAIQHNLVSGAKRFDYAFNAVSDITAVQRDSALGDGYTYDLTQQITELQTKRHGQSRRRHGDQSGHDQQHDL